MCRLVESAENRALHDNVSEKCRYGSVDSINLAPAVIGCVRWAWQLMSAWRNGMTQERFPLTPMLTPAGLPAGKERYNAAYRLFARGLCPPPRAASLRLRDQYRWLSRPWSGYFADFADQFIGWDGTLRSTTLHSNPYASVADITSDDPCTKVVTRYAHLYIGWQWRNIFISAVSARHFVVQALRNVCCSDISRRHFLNNIAIVRTFSWTNWFNFIPITRQIFTI